jgi:hypothetical protein
MDYNSLTAQIQQYAKRTDQFFIDQIPNFIDQGINRIYSEAKSIGFETVVNNNLTANSSSLAKPANWKETVSINIMDDRPGANPISSFLFLRSLEFCKSYWPNSVDTSTPTFYADFEGYNAFYIAPTPDYAYPFQLIYLSLPLFNQDNPTNFLTERYPSLLLYASMLETTPFLKDDERVPVFESLYNRALQGVNQDSKKLYIDRIAKRDVT